MDITFEEVAHVIQDARYQQAILDTDIPKPEKKIPGPGRLFNYDEFVKDSKVTLTTAISEPLGRFFLRSFIIKGSDEEKILNFIDALFVIKRRDPFGIVNALDIVTLVERFGVNIPLLGGKMLTANNNNSFEDKKDKEHSSSDGGNRKVSENERSGSTSAKNSVTKGIAGSDVITVIGSIGEFQIHAGGGTGSISISASTSTAPAPARNTHQKKKDHSQNDGTITVMTERESASRGGIQSAWNETHVSRDDGDNNLEEANPISTFVASYSSYGAGVAAAVSRAAASQKQHSHKSIELNVAVQSFIESALANAYERFRNNRKTYIYYLKLKWYSLQSVKENHVLYHRVLGTGAFGTVNGCIVACLGSMLAVKTMSKKRIKAKRAKSQVVAERQALEALAACPSPYCMRLRYAYETREAFHLILPLAIGGDLKFHLKDGPFSEERARIYAAEVALGLGHIHSLGLIIRDLKPRNILLNSNGHCQISDLGLAVSIADGRTCRGRAGTEGYWSPEVINNLHYSIDADWWSYGCCLFEFHTDFNPFSCKHTGMKTRNEGTRKSKIRFTKDFPETAKPLVNALLNRNVSERLGCRGKGVAEVLNEKHAYWKPLDLDKIRRNELPAPWLPEKGVIYALSQVEIQENEDDVELRKVKLTPEDEIEFPPFVDIEEHQHDIVKVLEISISNANNQPGNRQSVGRTMQHVIQNDEEKSSCCIIS